MYVLLRGIGTEHCILEDDYSRKEASPSFERLKANLPLSINFLKPII